MRWVLENSSLEHVASQLPLFPTVAPPPYPLFPFFQLTRTPPFPPLLFPLFIPPPVSASFPPKPPPLLFVVVRAASLITLDMLISPSVSLADGRVLRDDLDTFCQGQVYLV